MAVKKPKEPTTTFSVRFVKLTNGDDLLCEMSDLSDGLMIVRNPLRVSTVYDPTTEDAMYVFLPWIPFTAQEMIAINKLTVVSITTVRDEISVVYKSRVKEHVQETFSTVTKAPSMDSAPPPEEERDDHTPPDPSFVKKWLN